MEIYQEFDQPIGTKKNTSAIITHSIEMFKGVFGYGIIMTMLYFLASSLIQPISGFNSQEFSQEILSADGDYSAISFISIPGLSTYYVLSGLLGILISSSLNYI